MEANSPIRPSSVDDAEVAQFAAIADQWWDERGKFAPLHRINPLRIGWIRDQACAALGRDANALKPLDGLRLVDIGCGGGLIAEPMARLGAKVTGIDAAQRNIDVARTHAARSGLEIDYRCTTAEALAAEARQFDVVLALEIIEHVATPPEFIASCTQLVAPGGVLIMSTLNRTTKSFALAIVGAEYILRWLPRGTHDWKKFLRPSEMAGWLRDQQFDITRMSGMVFNPLANQWRWDERDLSVNYILAAQKE